MTMNPGRDRRMSIKVLTIEATLAELKRLWAITTRPNRDYPKAKSTSKKGIGSLRGMM